MTELKIHPKADLFPMMSADELAAVAEDIKANGLKHPIVLDSDGELIVDGRNRFRACKMAGVESIFRNLNGLSFPPICIAAISPRASRRCCSR